MPSSLHNDIAPGPRATEGQISEHTPESYVLRGFIHMADVLMRVLRPSMAALLEVLKEQASLLRSMNERQAAQGVSIYHDGICEVALRRH